MEISQYAMLLLHAYAGILGVCLGLLYDGFRVTRIFLGAHYSRRVAKRLQELRLPFLSPYGKRRESRFLGLAVFLEDLLFCILAGISFILLLYEQNNGRFRLSALICACLGFLLYRVTFGRLFIYASEWIAFAIATAVRYLLFFLLYPIRALGRLLRRATDCISRALLARARRKKRRHFTALQQKRILRDACGMLPEELPRPRKGNKENGYGKGKQKAIQPELARAHSSGRSGGGHHRRVCR